MRLHCTLLVSLNLLIVSSTNGREGSSLTTEKIVTEDGYPFEKHECETADGYILTIHRIPYSPRNATLDMPNPRRVVFLMHGILTSSSDYVLLGPDNSLSYILADAGFDVWMGNVRGSRYSQNHTKYSTSSRRFWTFSFPDMATFDLPAMFDKVLSITGVDQLDYIGHSQGGTILLVLASLNPEYTRCIKSAHLLAPATFLNHGKSLAYKTAGVLLGHPQPFIEFIGGFEILPNTKEGEVFGNTICKDGSPLQFLCSLGIFLITGFDAKNLNTTLLPNIFATFPASASINQIYHFAQEYMSGHFRQFDYGLLRNLEKYGTMVPPDFPLDKVILNISVHYGSNDWLVDPEGIHRMADKVPNLKTCLVADSEWNHIDFLWSPNATRLVYYKIMKDLLENKVGFCDS